MVTSASAVSPRLSCSKQTSTSPRTPYKFIRTRDGNVVAPVGSGFDGCTLWSKCETSACPRWMGRVPWHSTNPQEMLACWQTGVPFFGRLNRSLLSVDGSNIPNQLACGLGYVEFLHYFNLTLHSQARALPTSTTVLLRLTQGIATYSAPAWAFAAW